MHHHVHVYTLHIEHTCTLITLPPHTDTHAHIRTYTHVRVHTCTPVEYTHTSIYLTCGLTSIRKVLKDAEAHLLLATKERSYYKTLVDKAKAIVAQTFTVDGELKLPSLDAWSSPGNKKISMHYSFEMAQQVRNSFTIVLILPV